MAVLLRPHDGCVTDTVVTVRYVQAPQPYAGPGPALFLAGGITGWWDDHGVPAPWPDDFFDPDSEWRPSTQLVILNPDEQPF